MKTYCAIISLAILSVTVHPIWAQVVVIPDPGLQAAVSDALDISADEISVEDMERLTKLDASDRNINSIAGLETARNLTELDLSGNQFTTLVLPQEFISLITLDLSQGKLTSLTLPEGLRNLRTLILRSNQLTSLTLPAGLTSMRTLSLWANQLTSLTLPEGLRNLKTLSLWSNQLTSLTLPNSMINLEFLNLISNPLTNLTMPAGKIEGTPSPFIQIGMWPSLKGMNDQGVDVTLFPKIEDFRRLEGGNCEFTLYADVGTFKVHRSIDLMEWVEIGEINIPDMPLEHWPWPHFPRATFTDSSAQDLDTAYYLVEQLGN